MRLLHSFPPGVMRANLCWAIALCAGVMTASAETATKSIEVAQQKIAYRWDGNGANTVVVLSGLGDRLESWDTVMPAMRPLARVFRYDRPGYGNSEWNGTPRDAATVAGELHALVQTLNVSKPFVIVAHSIGCFYAEVYASRYPEDVKALLLIDPSDGSYRRRLRSVMSAKAYQEWEQELQKAFKQSTPVMEAERAAFMQSADEARRAGDLRLPTIVLTGTRTSTLGGAMSPEGRELWRRVHQEWVETQSHAKHILVDSGHYIHHDQPDAVISALEQLLQSNVGKARQHTAGRGTAQR